MKTSRPFSTISYNSPDFLRVKLDELITRRAISFYAFIFHKKEEDEQKDHIHLHIIPNGSVNTDDIRDYLKEFTLADPLRPLGCMPFEPSKFDDWALYSTHNALYLASKGQSRKYSYTIDEMVTSDFDYFLEKWKRIDMSKLNRFFLLSTAVDEGVPFESLLATGQIPIQQVFAYQKAYELLSGRYATYRGDRETHSSKEPPLID